MHPQKENKRPAKRRPKKGTGISGIAIIIILLVAGVFLLFPFISKKLQDKQPDETSRLKQIAPVVKQEISPKKPNTFTVPKRNANKKDLTDGSVESLGNQVEDVVKESPQTKAESCEKTTESVISFYNHLDQQEYIQDAGLDSKSSQHFTNLIQKLLDNPPVVTRETDDLFTILQNTAHFFRVIGKKNITIIKGILHNEKDRFEYVLADYFDFVLNPDCSRKETRLVFPQNSLYDYAGFFLNTMGGRLYLFRRDSHSRMVIIYYSILVVDRANQNVTNRHGIQIKQSIDSLISEIESVGSHLKLREQYLDKLYDLKEKYQ